MKEYGPVLQTMFPEIKQMIGTSNPWTQDLQDNWIGELIQMFFSSDQCDQIGRFFCISWE